jgi:hypothetical protein
MNFEKIFKVVALVLFALAIFVYGMANRYQFFHIANSLTGLACSHYTGKCEWLSPDEMGVEKVMKYSEKQREAMEKRAVPQAQAPAQGPVPAPKPESPR